MQTRLCLLFLLIVTFPAAAQVRWEPIVEAEGNLFPSYIIATAAASQINDVARMVHVADSPSGGAELSTATSEAVLRLFDFLDGRAPRPTSAGVPESYIGDVVGQLGAYVTSPRAGAFARLEVSVPGFVRSAYLETYLPRAGVRYELFPLVEYDFDRLLAQRQPMPATATFRLYVDQRFVGEKRVPIRIRSVNEVVFEIVHRDGQRYDYAHMFAAYVNEDHPWLDTMLREALATGAVDGFYGYQMNDPQMVHDQVFALWNALQRRSVTYSSITRTSGQSGRLGSQYVRFLDEAVTNRQANCADGTVLFASLLRKIGLDPVLVLLPTHMYVGYYVDPEHTQITFLETTMLGQVQASRYDDAEIFNRDSAASFLAAQNYATSDYRQNSALIHQPARGYGFVDVARVRALGFMPVNR